MPKLYDNLADWWPLVSDPADYAEEVAFFLPLLAEAIAGRPASLLELGSGGGNNASHMKGSFAALTLVDLSPGMLAVSRRLNPECDHLLGDMRTVRLGRTFDVVFIHDAIEYMTSLTELRQAIYTAFVHCRPGGLALFVPDHVRESFAPATDHGGHDAAVEGNGGGEPGRGRAVRYLEWVFDPDPADTTYIADYVFILRQGDEIIGVEHDRHVLGLFGRDEWLAVLSAAGFRPEAVPDNFGRLLFLQTT